jgi:hypothetical protein
MFEIELPREKQKGFRVLQSPFHPEHRRAIASPENRARPGRNRRAGGERT